MRFWAKPGFADSLGLLPPTPEPLSWPVPGKTLGPILLSLLAQVAVLTVTERAVPLTPASPEDPAPLWGSPAAQGSPGDGDLQGEWVCGEHTPLW